jgi:hypothetical protein
MRTFDATDFVNIIREGVTPLSLTEFYETKQIGNLWDKLEPDDIRVTTLKTKKAFYDYCYNFIHDDEPLIEYFNKRLAYKDVKGVSVVPVTRKEIKNSSNNTRVIRNIHLESILNCTESDGMNLKFAYKTALETGKINKFFTMPSVFEGAYHKNYVAFIVTAKTVTGQVSVFSPSVYKTLLEQTDKYVDASVGKQKLLIPSASWSSPILATVTNNNYSDIHIVDVQSKVLDVTKDLYDHLHPGIFFDAPYQLKTFCVPSERMSEVIDEKYDKVFFCPPYYDLELYPGDNQSTEFHPTYETWLEEYWKRTVKECSKLLKQGGVFSFVMGALCRERPLASDMLKIAEEEFTLVDSYRIFPPVESTKAANHIEKFEICYILNKY